MKKLLLFGPDSIHLINYLDLISGYFDEILVVTDGQNKSLVYPKQEIIDFSIRNPLKNRAKILKIKKIVKDFNPTIIHLHNIGTGAYLLEKAIRQSGIPKVATAWGSDVLVATHRSFIFRRIVKNVLSNFNYFTCDAYFMANEMQKLVANELDIKIANFGVERVEIDETAKENIIYSNRLHNPLYRIESIIDLFHKYSENNPNSEWKLVVAATGSETENLKIKVQKSNFASRIEFVGWINSDQNLEWYKKAKIYISIPKSDGTSISLLEAMENGCVPIVSNLPANNEWITDEFNGIIFKNNLDSPIEKAISLNREFVIKINREIIYIHGLKPSNRAKFLAIYDQAFDLK
jgi:glycosyltransferase involved in cell wall biosynthesis